MLQTNQRFQDDVKRFTSAIENLPEGQDKVEANKLLNDLIYEVKNMDNMFMDMVYNKQLPSLGAEMKDKITSIRKKLDQKLKNIPSGEKNV